MAKGNGAWYMFYDRDPTWPEKIKGYFEQMWYNIVEDYLVWRESRHE